MRLSWILQTTDCLHQPDITLVTVLHFGFLPLRFGDFDRLEIMDKLHFLIEDLFAGIIATEEFRF
jgi:hypothetical protein